MSHPNIFECNQLRLLPPEVDKKALRIALLDRALQSGVHLETDDASQMRLEAGLAVAAEMYPLHPLEIQIHIGLFTWFGFIIDDMNVELGLGLEQFQTRLLVGERQPSALLQAFADVLKSTKWYYDPIVANLIVLSALAFVNSNAIQIRPQCPDIACFLPAAPEMGKFINLTNDVLSPLTCGLLNQSPLSILESVILETVVAYNLSGAILKNSHPYEGIWHAYAMGYVAMHLNTRRYYLSEIVL
ncbi:longiborneol synthase [Colletotrichum salicis]|uniref:Longiborneol synthase n=1 Tax=Colletotrichum salicis TaxID=1209931 RepID=A0A135SNV1_9PEZI|nr:longiborneol synthase [Colletotrichum salicis]